MSRFSRLVSKWQQQFLTTKGVVWLDLGSDNTKLKLDQQAMVVLPSNFLLASKNGESVWVKPIAMGQVVSSQDLLLFLNQKIKPHLQGFNYSDYRCLLPSSSTRLEQKIFTQILSEWGVARWQLVLKKNSPQLSQLKGGFIDLGAMTTEVILNDGQHSVATTLKWGSYRVWQSLQAVLKQKYQLEVSEESLLSLVQEIKDSSWAIANHKTTQKISVRGKDESTFMPHTKVVELAVLRDGLLSALDELTTEMMLFLSRVDTQLLTKVLAEKLIISGGLSQLVGIDQYWSEKLKTQCEVKPYVYF